MTKNSKNFIVSTADVAFFHNGMLAFTGTTALNTSLSVSMEDQEITGGKGNKTLYKYKYGRKLSPSIEMAEWRLEYIAANVGSTIFEGLKEAFKIAECVTLVKGVGVLDKVPVGKVFVEKNDGSTVEVEPVGSTITVGTEDDTVKVTYQYNTKLKRITIDADSTPLVGELVLSADKHNNLKGKVGEVQIDVPSFQLNGTFDISLESGGNATTKLEGDALAIQGATCADGDVYAYISEIDSVESSISVSDLVATPGVIEIAVDEEKKISVVGIKGGLYSNIGIDVADCVITSESSSIATVSDGVVKGVGTGTTYINVEYEGLKDIIKVVVS